ncbi:MAG: hypothetical protein ABIQ58_08930 [Candidatus Limnocylindrales bacterium]
MHIQARANVRQAAFTDDDEGGGDGTASVEYGAGALSEMLRILEEAGFNLRAASGRMIELDGYFSFWVDPRRAADGSLVDVDHEVATEAAIALLQGEGYDVHGADVQHKLLDDEPGALRRFVDEIRQNGLLIEEISVGTPGAGGRIPVQAYTSRQLT